MNASTNRCITLLLGGVRSGKSGYAQQLATTSERVAFIATAEALDPEMEQRITRHRQERPAGWTTFEAPLALAETIQRCNADFDLILVECLTLWVSNLMNAEHNNPERIFARAARLIEALRQSSASVVLVSNEVGCGIVPENDAARLYRDLLGGVNQRIAAIAERVLLMVAGYPLTVKESAVPR